MTGPQDPQDPNLPPPQGPYGNQPQYPSQSPPPYGGPPGEYPPQYPPQSPQYPSQYPSQSPQYPPQYPPQSPPQSPPRAGLWQRLGSRATHRPAPRFGVTITGVGIALVVIGIIVWGITYIADGAASGFSAAGPASSGDSRRFLGFALALILVVIGYALIVIVRTGPLVTAGIAATALGVPVAMEFLTLDLASGDPVNTDAVVWVSVVAYLISYLVVRGARGHSIYLGLTLLLLWEYAVSKAAPSANSIGAAVVRPFVGVGDGFSPSLDTGTVAGVSLVFAVGYFLIAWGLDHTGRHGVAVPFVVVGIPATLVGIGALAQDTKQIGTGIILFLVGLVLSRYGARYDRRFTAWFWGLASAVGAVVFMSKFATTGTSIGISMVVLGLLFVVGGWLAAKSLREPDDMATVAPVQPGVPVA